MQVVRREKRLTHATSRRVRKRLQEKGRGRIAAETDHAHLVVIAPVAIIRVAGRTAAQIGTNRSRRHQVERQIDRHAVGEHDQIALLDADFVRIVVRGLVGRFPDRRQANESRPGG